MADPEVLKRELAYHEKLYSGFAQRHFARPAVRLLRCHTVARILHLTGAGKESRVLSLGCGIGDTELLLAPYVAEVVGVDLSPAAIRQARADAERHEIHNVRFEEGSDAEGRFDVVMAIFFLHHLPNDDLAELPRQVQERLAPGGTFYSLDPSRRRLSGALGRLLVPWMMKRYQTPDERELEPESTCRLFSAAGFDARVEMYDFGSTPLAGLFPGWGWGYGFAREFDDWLLRFEALRRRGSNFEILARWPTGGEFFFHRGFDPENSDYGERPSGEYHHRAVDWARPSPVGKETKWSLGASVKSPLFPTCPHFVSLGGTEKEQRRVKPHRAPDPFGHSPLLTAGAQRTLSILTKPQNRVTNGLPILHLTGNGE